MAFSVAGRKLSNVPARRGNTPRRRRASAHHFQPKPLGLAYVLEIGPVELLPFLLGHPVADDTLVAHPSLLAGPAALTPITSALDRRHPSLARRPQNERVGSPHSRGTACTILREVGLIPAQRGDGRLGSAAVQTRVTALVRAADGRRREDASSPRVVTSHPRLPTTPLVTDTSHVASSASPTSCCLPADAHAAHAAGSVSLIGRA